VRNHPVGLSRKKAQEVEYLRLDGARLPIDEKFAALRPEFAGAEPIRHHRPILSTRIRRRTRNKPGFSKVLLKRHAFGLGMITASS
jgi:hypothetical protein